MSDRIDLRMILDLVALIVLMALATIALVD
jgi:hypothetical protein